MLEITENKYREYIPNITKARITKIEEAKLFDASPIKKIQYATREGFLVELRMFLHKYLGIYNKFYTEVQKKHAKIKSLILTENILKIINNYKDIDYKDIDDVRDAIISNVFFIQQILEPFNINFLLQADYNNNNIKINFGTEEEQISFDIPCQQALYKILKEVFGTHNDLNSSQENKYAYLKYFNNFKNFVDKEEADIIAKALKPDEISHSIELKKEVSKTGKTYTNTDGKRGSALSQYIDNSINSALSQYIMISMNDIHRMNFLNANNQQEAIKSFEELIPQDSKEEQKQMLFLLFNQNLFVQQYSTHILATAAVNKISEEMQVINDLSLPNTAKPFIELDNANVILTCIRNHILISEHNNEEKKIPIKLTVKVKIDKSGKILEFSTIDTLINNGESLDNFPLKIRLACKIIESYSNYITTIRNGKIPVYAQQIQENFNKDIEEKKIIIAQNTKKLDEIINTPRQQKTPNKSKFGETNQNTLQTSIILNNSQI